MSSKTKKGIIPGAEVYRRFAGQAGLPRLTWLSLLLLPGLGSCSGDEAARVAGDLGRVADQGPSSGTDAGLLADLPVADDLSRDAGTAPPPDAGPGLPDQGLPPDTGGLLADLALPLPDLGSPFADLDPPPPDSAAPPMDLGPPPPDEGPPDLGPPPDPWADRPRGQCTRDEDCPPGPLGSTCSRQVPGGICVGCGADDDHCPAGARCSEYGSCVIDCQAEADCPPGQTCGGNGLCRAAACVDGACPIPLFGCDDSARCRRLPCPAAAPCPAGTRCHAGLCLEERMLP